MIRFDPETHTYWEGDRAVPGVSAILQATGLSTDYAAVPPAVLWQAAQRGQYVDQACGLWDAGDLDLERVHPACRPYVDAWIAFRAVTGFQPVYEQPRLYHAELMYAGTADVIGRFRDERWAVLDRKCVSKLHRSYGLQLAAYSTHGIELADGSAMPESFPEDWDRGVVWLKKDGTYTLVMGPPIIGPRDHAVWRGLVERYHWEQGTWGATR